MRKVIFEETSNGITIDRIIRSYNYNMPSKHFHDEYEIYYLLEGERYYFIDQQSFYINKGTLVIIKKGQIHKTSFANSTYHDRILIELKEEPFASYFNMMGDVNFHDFFDNYAGIMQLDEKGQKHIEYLLTSIATEIQQKLMGYETAIMTKLSQILLYVMRKKNSTSLILSENTRSSKHKKIDDIASYITSNYTSPMSLDSLSKDFYVSKCYLSRIFKEITSFTVNEYINMHRIKKAEDLLLNSDYTIQEISEMIGFTNISYFERLFKKFTETSPLKYRKLNRKKDQAPRTKKNEHSDIV